MRSPCANGCRNEGTLKCSGCGSIVYCSKACQKSHWKTHKPTCILIREAVDRATNDINEVSSRALKGALLRSSEESGQGQYIFSQDAVEEWKTRKSLALDYINSLDDEREKGRLQMLISTMDDAPSAMESLAMFDANEDIQEIVKSLFPARMV